MADKSDFYCLLVDDHPLMRRAMSQVLRCEYPDVRIDEAADAAHALKLASLFRYDLVLLDLCLPDTKGFDCLEMLKRERPDVPVLVVSMHDEIYYAAPALKAGASGYLEKQQDETEIVRAVRTVLTNGIYISEALARHQAMAGVRGMRYVPHERLTEREFEVMCHIGEGRTVSKIACQLCRSVKTVSSHRANILQKMNMQTNSELVHYCHKIGLVR
jgi:DNA-binding NarL/FixJ family response regulator